MRQERGITLVTLVVTIVVLIILAGVSINLILGDNGIITVAKKAKENMEIAQEKEETELNELYAQLESEGGNSEETTYDAIAKLLEFKEKIAKAITTAGIQTSKEDSAETMSKNIEQLSNSKESVYYVTLTDGYKLPVPKGFYYVGGDLSTGAIISDNVADKYDGKTDKTTFAYTTSLKGNQFVWIPCTSDGANGTIKYEKTSWGKQNTEWDATTPKAELSQIEKYGGFYVGRYEAGLASDMSEFTSTQQHTASNQVYNVYKIPQSKAGLAPWNFVDWTHSKANAESMYNTNYVSSGLITGTQWDVILNVLKNKTSLSDNDIKTNSNSWGNYKNTAIAYKGRKATAYYSSGSWYLPVFGSIETSTTKSYSDDHGDLLTTGASSITEKYHVFDIAGNLWEWTEEDSHYATNGQYREARGSSYIFSSSDYPVCYRACGSVSETDLHVGFRVVLYIK